MILVRLSEVWRFISTSRSCPRFSARSMIPRSRGHRIPLPDSRCRAGSKPEAPGFHVVRPSLGHRYCCGACESEGMSQRRRCPHAANRGPRRPVPVLANNSTTNRSRNRSHASVIIATASWSKARGKRRSSTGLWLQSKPGHETAKMFQTHCCPVNSVGFKEGEVVPQIEGIRPHGPRRALDGAQMRQERVDRFDHREIVVENGPRLCAAIRRQDLLNQHTDPRSPRCPRRADDASDAHRQAAEPDLRWCVLVADCRRASPARVLLFA
jgi:hypothetical protein